MKATQLAAILATHGDREVLIWAPDSEGEVTLCPIANVEYDAFHPDGPTVVTLDIDFSNTTTDAVAEWLDAEGELPVAKNHRTVTDMQQSDADPQAVDTAWLAKLHTVGSIETAAAPSGSFGVHVGPDGPIVTGSSEPLGAERRTEILAALSKAVVDRSDLDPRRTVDAWILATWDMTAEVSRLASELDETTDLDRSALKTQELRDERERAIRRWHDEKKRAERAEAEADRLRDAWQQAWAERNEARDIVRTLVHQHIGVHDATIECEVHLNLAALPDWVTEVANETAERGAP